MGIWGKTEMSKAFKTMVRCSRCGQEWSRDPALEVPCPVCLAKTGQKCRRPSGYTGNFVEIHAERDVLAMKEVPGYGLCP